MLVGQGLEGIGTSCRTLRFSWTLRPHCRWGLSAAGTPEAKVADRWSGRGQAHFPVQLCLRIGQRNADGLRNDYDALGRIEAMRNLRAAIQARSEACIERDPDSGLVAPATRRWHM